MMSDSSVGSLLTHPKFSSFNVLFIQGGSCYVCPKGLPDHPF